MMAMDWGGCAKSSPPVRWPHGTYRNGGCRSGGAESIANGPAFPTIDLEGSTSTVDDPAPVQVVGGDFDLHAVSWDDANKVLSHFPSDVREDLMTVLEFDTERGIRQRLGHDAVHGDGFFLRQKLVPPSTDASTLG